MATWLVDKFWWPKHDNITSIKPSAFFGYFNVFDTNTCVTVNKRHKVLTRWDDFIQLYVTGRRSCRLYMSSSSLHTELRRDTWNTTRTGKSTRNGDVNRGIGVTATFVFVFISRWRWAVMIHVPGHLTPGMELWYPRLGRKLRVGDRDTVLWKPRQDLDCPSDAQIFHFQETQYWNAFTYSWKTWAYWKAMERILRHFGTKIIGISVRNTCPATHETHCCQRLSHCGTHAVLNQGMMFQAQESTRLAPGAQK
jgi:hypothetical protein